MEASRRETVLVKSDLNSTLTSLQSISYFSSLKDYLKGKINKIDLDYIIRNWTVTQKRLHNELLLNILFNSSLSVYNRNFNLNRNFNDNGSDNVNVNVGLSLNDRNGFHKVDHLDNFRHFTSEKLSLRSLSKRERDRIKHLDKSSLVKPLDFKSYDVIPHTFSNIPFDLELCIESKSLPSFESLAARMSLIANENGLNKGVDPSTVSILQIGLDYHLKNILSSTINKLKFNHLNHLFDESDNDDLDLERIDSELFQQSNLKRRPINLSDLDFTLTSNPQLQVENLGSLDRNLVLSALKSNNVVDENLSDDYFEIDNELLNQTFQSSESDIGINGSSSSNNYSTTNINNNIYTNNDIDNINNITNNKTHDSDFNNVMDMDSDDDLKSNTRFPNVINKSFQSTYPQKRSRKSKAIVVSSDEDDSPVPSKRDKKEPHKDFPYH